MASPHATGWQFAQCRVGVARLRARMDGASVAGRCARAMAHGLSRWLLIGLAMAFAAASLAQPARAAAVELVALQRSAEPHTGIAIDYAVRVDLPKAVVEAMQRGVPMYFQAQATMLRPRWYWRDERIARATRSWRVAYQPLTSSWRVGQGGLTQGYPTLSEALASIARGSNWLIAEPHRVQADERYLVQFSWRLDPSPLPAPMQLGIGADDWNVHLEAEFGVTP